jgi:monofunctional biosynthetic peptidoglycan transglycosylase
MLALILISALAAELLLLGSAAVGNSFLPKWDPGTTAFIQDYEFSHWRRADFQWTPLSQISTHLIRAVLVAEDDAFFEHEGLDLKELKASWEKNLKRKRIVRGGSTLTMQLVKNLYLSPSRNPIRKFNEIVLALDLEAKASKRRILEVYLNVAEWGEGIFGAQAASHYYFQKDAQQLTVSEAAYLASILPNPVYLSQKAKGRARYRQNLILQRMGARILPPDI